MGEGFPLATSTWDSKEYEALQSVITSGRFTMGPEVKAFESEFSEHFGARFGVMVNSGSSANLLTVAAAVLSPHIRLSPGDEVLVPAVSWPTTFYPLHQYGLTMRFVDVDVDTLNVDLDLLEASIGPNTRAVFAVSLLGNPVDFERLLRICEEHDLVLIEDNCESLGATLGGRATGTFGVMGTFSTFFSHHIATMEGGLVVTDDEYLYQAMLSLRAHGWTRDLERQNLIHDKTGDPFADSFRFVLPGYNLRPLEMSGALGREQLKKVPDIIAGRRANALIFREKFGSRENLRIQRETGESSWFGFSFLLEGSLKGRRAEVVEALTQANIESRPIVAGNFARNPVVKHLRTAEIGPLPVADLVDDHGLFVGNHHFPIAEQLELLDEVLTQFDD
ncbi:pyridoxamine 5-phosphate oxidase [Salinibacterium hongtaonis]|uniref:Pyridoxamine 5-phosphate oxidase n=1 Tax=Homoserinimonas hongtaonis TaxID=2079791 RepID=A0A2U1SXJ8_9MICO|nr:pyridoxamine 5-phosphate oxidase [Salinibacterium hongtaonis]